jgi:uncharacterized Fe-S center protein
MKKNSSDVYFIRVNENEREPAIEEKVILLYENAGFDSFIKKNDIVAIKTHFGEMGNTTHIKANYIRQIVKKVKENGGKPYLTETSVLYKGNRSNALSHILLAFEHGFSYENVGAPIIMSDGFLGNWEREVKINGEYYDSVSVAGDSISADKLLVVSHTTGHMLAGFGAAFKNMGMGLSSRKGKLDQHSQVAPSIDRHTCTFCGQCIKWCPENAIIEKNEKAFILDEKCIGCGECIAVCKPGAVKFQWDSTSEMLQKKMVEHAYGIFVEKRGSIAYINFLLSMTSDCDCMAPKKKFLDDIGILASFDPVAIDLATLDLTKQYHGDNISKLAFPHLDPMIQIDHAKKLGMGNTSYKIIEI